MTLGCWFFDYPQIGIAVVSEAVSEKLAEGRELLESAGIPWQLWRDYGEVARGDGRLVDCQSQLIARLRADSEQALSAKRAILIAYAVNNLEALLAVVEAAKVAEQEASWNGTVTVPHQTFAALCTALARFASGGEHDG